MRPVVKANLLVLASVMIYGAAVMLPRRLESPDFLVTPLGLLVRAYAVW